MNTREMIDIALKLAGLEEDTVDTEIGCPREHPSCSCRNRYG